MAAIDEPCVPWTDLATVYALPGTRPVEEEQDQLRTENAIRIASAWLYRLSGRRFSGACEITVRPIGRGACYADRFLPSGQAVSWFDSRTGRYGYNTDGPPWDDRGSEGVSEVSLGYAPIRTVTLVTIDGVAFTDYRIDDAATLVRTDGSRWPAWQDLAKPTTEPDTWAVTFTYGDDPPADGIHAAAVLANEVLLSMDPNGGQCRLHPRVTTITRQGVAAVVFDPMALIERGRFGIYEIDAFLSSVNPYGLAERAQVLSPDTRRAVRRAGTVPGS